MIIRSSKYVTIDTNNPDGLGQCDYSGFIFNHSDLVKQMEWQGDNLVWTGFMVGRPFLDKPQPQNRPPKVKNDPKPFSITRYPLENYTDPLSNPAPAPNVILTNLENVRFDE